MRLHIGTIEGAETPSAPPGTLDPQHFNSDWTASLVAPPTGWSETGGPVAYTATGAYSTDVDGSAAQWSLDGMDRDLLAATIIIAYTVNAWGNFSANVQMNQSVSPFGGIRGGDIVFETTGSEGFMAMNLDANWIGDEVDLTNADPTGLVILAGVMEQDGGKAFYRFDDNGAVTIGTNSTPAPDPLTNIGAGLVMQNYDFGNDVPGTPGDVRIHHTYIGFDEELSLVAITAIVTAWGWS